MNSTDSLLLGIDVGTHKVRVGLFSGIGDLIAYGTSSYEVFMPRPGWAEQKPAEVWSSLMSAVHACLEEVGPDAVRSVIGIGLVGTTVTMVACDESGAPLLPALLWMDTRSALEADEISSLSSEWLKYSGDQVSPEWGLPKALWLKRNHPDIYNRADRISGMADWLRYRLTGHWTASLNTISAEWSYVSHLGGWPTQLLDSIDMGDLITRLPPVILEPGSAIGGLSESAGELLGIKSGTPVAQGLMDSYASTLGLNIFAPGRLTVSIGTSSAYIALADSPRFHPGLLGPVPDALGYGTWALHGGQTSAGAILEWYKNRITENNNHEELNASAADIPPGAEGVVALDCWQGSRSPHRDPLARGALWGLHLGHTKSHIYRALLESVAFGGRQIIETMASVGVQTDELWVCGGGTQSNLWMQIHADVMGLPLVLAPHPNMAMLGAAICAGVAAGVYPDIQVASEAMEQPGRRIMPDDETHNLYSQYYKEYQQGYPMLRESYHRLAGLST